MSHATLKEALLTIFNSKVVHDSKKIKLTPKTVLDDYALQREWAVEWGDTLADRVEREFGIPMKRLRKRPVMEILKHIENGKKKFNSLPPGLQIHLSKGRK